MDKLSNLCGIFDQIFNLNVCGYDPRKVKRDLSKVNPNSDLMIIAEAMAPSQVRLSGVNYFYKDGTIGNTGRYLEKFLNIFGFSVYPEHQNCVYHTEVVHNFPGYELKNGKKFIKRPNKTEIQQSIESGILAKEIEIIKPKLILLMGSTAYSTFYKYILGESPIRNLSEEIEYISNNQTYKIYEDFAIIPIQHSSGVNPRFSKMLKNEDLINLIKQILNKE